MKPASCPLPELVQASRMETLPPGVQERVAAHVLGCESCRALLEDLDDPEIAEPTPEERLRLRARVRSRARTARSPRRGSRCATGSAFSYSEVSSPWVLRRFAAWPWASLRPGQDQAVRSVLEGRGHDGYSAHRLR